MARKIFQYLVILGIALAATALPASAQEVTPLPDSLKTIPRQHLDSLSRADSLKTAQAERSGSIELCASVGGMTDVHIAGGSRIRVGQCDGSEGGCQGDVPLQLSAPQAAVSMKLTADYLEYDMLANTVYARGQKDPVTGEMVGLPEMTDNGQSYKMDELRYNFTTRKARITNMITKEAEGLLQGKRIKMMPDKSINMRDGMYTVCDLEEPHYYLKLSMAKVITKPSQKTVFGPAWPVVAGVPVPIGLPFGFVPKKPSRATGLLMPTFGEEQERGFYIRDAGMYFVFGDYFDLSVTGDYYTMGSWAVDINSRYKVNYKFNGNFGLTYSNDQKGEKGSADFVQSKNFGVKWSHSQDSKAHPGTSFTASVNFSSPSNNRYNATSVQQAQQNQIGSSISYSHNWNGKFSLSVNALHNQNTRDSSYNITLPNITFTVNRFYPFKQKQRVGKEKFYEKISFGYNTSFQNRVSFKMRDLQDYVMNGDEFTYKTDKNGNTYRVKEFGDSLMVKALGKMSNGMAHNFQIGLPNFTLTGCSTRAGSTWNRSWTKMVILSSSRIKRATT